MRTRHRVACGSGWQWSFPYAYGNMPFRPSALLFPRPFPHAYRNAAISADRSSPYMLGRRWLMGREYFISMQLSGGKRRGAKPRQAGRRPLLSFRRNPALLSLPGLHKAILHTAQWRSRAQGAPVHCGRVLPKMSRLKRAREGGSTFVLSLSPDGRLKTLQVFKSARVDRF